MRAGGQINPEFWGYRGGPYLASTRYKGYLGQNITGVVFVPVGYNCWNQEEWDLPDRFEREPRFVALYVTAEIRNLFLKGTRNALDRCGRCGSMSASCDTDRNLEATIEDVLLDPDGWDGSDFFFASFGLKYETFLSETGRRKLAEIGFEDLELREVPWMDPHKDRGRAS